MAPKSIMSFLLEETTHFMCPSYSHSTPSQLARGVRADTAIAEDIAPLHSLHLLTWNIDFRAPYPRARMEAALGRLEDVVSRIPMSSAVVIFLQEMREYSGKPRNREQEANDLSHLQEAA